MDNNKATQAAIKKVAQATLKEIINTYQLFKTRWVDTYGSENGFDAWFTDQIVALSKKQI